MANSTKNTTKNTKAGDKFTWHRGETTMRVDGVPGKFRNGKFVPNSKTTKK